MKYFNNKPIRLIECFAGIGSQAKALKNLGVDFEHYRVCEFDNHAINSYNAVHGTNFVTSDITKLTAKDLNITDTDKFTYLLTLFLVRIYPMRDWVAGWKKVAVREVVYSGKLRDYSMNAQSYHRCYLWRMCHRYMVRKIKNILTNG